MPYPFSADSFYSVWYWALTVLVWARVCHRTLGVPHDMVLRAARLPEVSGRVDALAHVAAARLAGLADAAGIPVAAGVGFVLAVLAAVGFGSGFEAAQAAFMLLYPLAIVGAATVRLAAWVRASGVSGPALLRALRRRRLWNQGVAIFSMLAAAVLALAHRPPLF